MHIVMSGLDPADIAGITDGMPAHTFTVLGDDRTAISAADVLFAWVNDETEPRTFADIGYALGCGTQVWVGCYQPARRLEPVLNHASVVWTEMTPRRALLAHLLGWNNIWRRVTDEERRRLRERVLEWVYVLTAGPYTKIGKAAHLDSRVKQISLQMPFAVTLAHAATFVNNAAVESALHTIFAAYRQNGEWFALRDDDLAWLLTVTEETLYQTYLSPTYRD